MLGASEARTAPWTAGVAEETQVADFRTTSPWPVTPELPKPRWRRRLGAATESAESDSLSVVRLRERIFRRSIVISDGLVTALAVLIAIDVHSGYLLRPGYLLVVPLVIFLAKLQGLYDRDELVIRKSTLDEIPRLINLATLVAMLLWLSRHELIIGAPSTWTLLRLWVLLILGITGGRYFARILAARLAPTERCFFIGDATTAGRLRDKLKNAVGSTLVGTASPEQMDLDHEGLLEVAQEFDIHRIIVQSVGGLAEERTVDLVRSAKATGLRVTICPGVLAVVGSSVVVDDVWGMTLLGVPRFGLSRSSAILKRCFDLVGSSLVLLFGAPLLAVIAILIKLDSRGPVLFRQLRVGAGGEEFKIVKFRTMVDGAEALKADLLARNEAEGLFKIDDDPRVTRVGHWLRRTSLDELPQLFNVVRGQMSLIGPRPLVLDEDRKITGLDRRRLMITPGMTGQWQILGSARVPLHEMIKLDYAYVANWSLWTDIKILLRTVRFVIARQGM